MQHVNGTGVHYKSHTVNLVLKGWVRYEPGVSLRGMRHGIKLKIKPYRIKMIF